MAISDWSQDLCSSALLARRQQRTGRLLTTDHDMLEPGGAPMPGIVAHRALLGGNAERIGNAPAGPLVVGREGNVDVAVVEDRIMLAVSLLDRIVRASCGGQGGKYV